MRRRASRASPLGALFACLLALVTSVTLLAGCGDDGDEASSALDNALGYFPERAPLAIAVETDLDGEQYQRLDDIIDKFPFGGALKKSIRDAVEDQAGDLGDLEPLLGHEFVVGTSNPQAIVGESSEDDFIGAIQAKSADKLQDAVRREKPKARGESNGAAIYRDDDGDPFAIKDDVLIVAGSEPQLKQALAQREAGNRLTEDRFDEATDELPDDGVARLYGDLEQLIAADPDTRDARKVKWVNALRTLGAAVSFKDDEADVDFRIETDSDGLSDEDLPIKAGSEAPAALDRPGEITAGLKDPTQIVDFAERAGQAVDPRGFSDYATAKRTIEKRLGISIEDDLLKQFEGDVGVTYALNGKFGVRTALKQPEAFDRTLARLGAVIPSIAESIVGESVGYAKPKRGGDFYALATANGDSVVYGVVDGVFVLANDPKIAGQLSKQSTAKVPAAAGSIVVNSDGQQLARQIIRRLEGGITGELAGALATRPLDRLTGSVSAETDAVTGHFRLTFD